MLTDAFRRLAHQLRGSLPSSDGLADALSKGQFREDDFIAAVAPILPERYRMSKGVIFNRAGAQSRPQDVIVSDRFVVGDMLSSATVGLHPVEAVLGSIQVKTSATPGTIRSAVDNVASVKRLVPEGSVRSGLAPLYDGGQRVREVDHTPFGGIFCFKLDGHPDSLVEAFHDASAMLEARERPNALLVLDSFGLFWGRIGDSGFPEFFLRSQSADDLLMIESDDGAVPLLQFFTFLLEFLRQYIALPLDYGEYMRVSGLQARARQWIADADPGPP